MAAAFVKNLGQTSNKTSGTTLALTLGSSAAGNLVVGWFVFDNSATASKPVVSSISKPGGETANWVFLGAARSTSTSAGAFSSGEMWAIKTTVAWTTPSITVTLDSSVTQKGASYMEFTLADAVLRSTTGSAYSATTTAASAVTTGTAPQAGDLALAMPFQSNSPSLPTGSNDTTGGSWSVGYGVGSTGGAASTNNMGIAQYKVLSATSHQTYANPAALTAGNGAIVAILTGIAGPKTATFTDDFATQVDPAKWPSVFGKAGWENTGRLYCQEQPGAAYSGATSVAMYDLMESSVYVRAIPPQLMTDSSETTLGVYANSSNGLFFVIFRDSTNLANPMQVCLRQILAGTSDNTFANYDPVSMAYIRIRMVGTTAYWETSPDATTWTVRRSLVTTLNMTAVCIELSVGQWSSTEATKSTGYFDNLNVIGAGSTVLGPVIQSIAGGRTTAVDTTSHAITLPTGIVAGELLVCVFSVDQAPTISTASPGWRSVGVLSQSTTVTQSVWFKHATGSDALTLTTSTAEQSSHVTYRFSGASCVLAAGATGSSTNSNPPSLNMAGADDNITVNTLWIATRTADSTVMATVAPASFTNFQGVVAAGTSGASTNTAVRAMPGQVLDPGTFTSATTPWVSCTLAVLPTWPKAHTLIESFDAASTNPPWAPWTANSSFSGGQMVLTEPSGSTAYAGYTNTASLWDLTDSSFTFQVVDWGDFAASGWTLATTPFELRDPQDYYAFHFFSNGGDIGMWADGFTGQVTIPFDPVNQKWVRIRESGGIIYGEVSPDRVNWTSVGTINVNTQMANGLDPTALVLRTTAGCNAGPPVAITAKLDNLNVALSNPKISTFTDTFDTQIDPAVWAVQSGVTWDSSGRVKIESLGTYPMCNTLNTYDFSNSSVFAKVWYCPDLDSRETLMTLEYGDWSSNSVGVMVSKGSYPSLGLRIVENGVTNYYGWTPYLPTEMQYLRLRMSGQTVYVDFSRDGTAWSNATSMTTVLSMTSVRLCLKAGQWAGTEPDTSFAYFDNINTAIAGNPKTETLQDSFPTKFDKWTWAPSDSNADANAVWDAGRLKITSQLSYYTVVKSRWALDLRESYIFCKMTAPDVLRDSREAEFMVRDSASNNTFDILISYQPGSPSGWGYYARNVENGTQIQSFLGDYDPVLHAWMRLRMAGTTIYFDTAPDGLTWTQRWSRVTASDFSSVVVSLTCGNWRTEVDNGSAWFDNFNVIPGGAAQTVSPIGIATAAAVGTPVRTSRITVTAAGIATAQAVGTPTRTSKITATATSIATGQALGVPVFIARFTVIATGIISVQAVGTPTVTAKRTVSITGIATAQVVGTPTVTAKITASPTGISTAQALGTVAVSAKVTVTATGIATSQVVGTPVVVTGSGKIYPSGIPSAQAFGTPTLTAGKVTVSVTGIATAQALGIPRTAFRATVTGIPTSQVLGTPKVVRTVAATGIASAQAFGALLVRTGNSVLPTGIATAQALGTPLIRATRTVTVTGISTAQAVGTVLVKAVRALTPTGIPTGQVVGTPLIKATRTVSLTGIPTFQAVGTPAVQFKQAIILTGVASIGMMGTPSFTNILLLTAEIYNGTSWQTDAVVWNGEQWRSDAEIWNGTSWKPLSV